MTISVNSNIQAFEKQYVCRDAVGNVQESPIEIAGPKDSVSFGSEVKTEEKQGGGIWKAICSAILPGSGQLIDGRTSTGLGFLGVWAALTGANFFTFREENKKISDIMKKEFSGELSRDAATKAINAINENRSTIKKCARFGFIGAGVTLALTAAINAYKGKKD